MMNRKVILQALEDAKAYRRNKQFVESHVAAVLGGCADGLLIPTMVVFISGEILIGFLLLFVASMLGLWSFVRCQRYINSERYDYLYMQATIDLTTFEDVQVKGESV